MNHRQSLADRRARSAIDRALDVRSTIAKLRVRARSETTKTKRDLWRAIARKIEKRRAQSLSVGWWISKAEEMLR